MYKCLCPITEKMYITVQLYVHTRLLCAAGLYENWIRVSKPILKISHTLMRTQTRLLDKLDCVWTVSLCVNDCGVSKGRNIELLPYMLIIRSGGRSSSKICKRSRDSLLLPYSNCAFLSMICLQTWLIAVPLLFLNINRNSQYFPFWSIMQLSQCIFFQPCIQY